MQNDCNWMKECMSWRAICRYLLREIDWMHCELFTHCKTIVQHSKALHFPQIPFHYLSYFLLSSIKASKETWQRVVLRMLRKRLREYSRDMTSDWDRTLEVSESYEKSFPLPFFDVTFSIFENFDCTCHINSQAHQHISL